MSGAVYEYTDNRGRVHRVSSATEVPKQYFKSLVVIGESETVQPADENSGAPFQTPTQLNPTDLLPGIAIIFFFVSKNFLVRCIAAAALAIWLMIAGWGKLETSKFLESGERKKGYRFEKGPAYVDPFRDRRGDQPAAVKKIKKRKTAYEELTGNSGDR